ncbi:MAG TPA: nicotinate (nicotinamide) nucleotide adenylyltransferase [Candidatus Cloacimonadota bacterium]|nr:nicotinate (nicotinamide) nucleotide adenylyltransferase [Candidatus Cloacimonadota bacterium]HPS38495.1 nicotinate (nicotinamide) nucleotide adenylyltransferase [Candidatus Cloacimonadota bacterium]
MTNDLLTGSIALLGGSFDPIHTGHLHLAEEILSLSGVAKVVFLPNGRHNFKRETVVLSFEERFSLISRAIASQPRFELWDTDRDGSGYTDELLRKIMRDHPGKCFCFVIGSDNLAKLDKWHNFLWLKEHIHFLIIPRPGWEISTEACSGIRCTILRTTPMDISSSRIRQYIKESRSISNLVPAQLEDEIYRIYQQRTKSE